jgi:hypothetical protein
MVILDRSPSFRAWYWQAESCRYGVDFAESHMDTVHMTGLSKREYILYIHGGEMCRRRAVMASNANGVGVVVSGMDDLQAWSLQLSLIYLLASTGEASLKSRQGGAIPPPLPNTHTHTHERTTQ